MLNLNLEAIEDTIRGAQPFRDSHTCRHVVETIAPALLARVRCLTQEPHWQSVAEERSVTVDKLETEVERLRKIEDAALRWVTGNLQGNEQQVIRQAVAEANVMPIVR